MKVPRDDDSVPSFVAEMAAVTVVGAGDDPVSARYLASSDDPLLLVMEDVHGGPSLADLLLGDDRLAAERAVEQYAIGLADLHAAGLPHAEAFAARVRSLGHDPTRSPIGEFSQRRERWDEHLARFGVETTRAADDLDAIGRSVTDAGRFRGIVHGDPCPDNVRFVDGRLRVFDFEWASLGNVLLDAVYPSVPFPTCWCVGDLPVDLSERASRAYREHVTATERDMVLAWAAWLVATTSTLLRRVLDGDDDEWGTTTFAARVAGRLDRFACRTSAAGELPGLTKVAHDLHERLVGAWTERDTALPAYPALAHEGDRVATVPDWWFEGA